MLLAHTRHATSGTRTKSSAKGFLRIAAEVFELNDESGIPVQQHESTSAVQLLRFIAEAQSESTSRAIDDGTEDSCTYGRL